MFSLSVIDRWEVKSEEIHPELRCLGNVIRTVFPNFTNFFFKLANRFLTVFKLPDLTRGVNYEQKYISREDGSCLRICVYTPEEAKENVPGLLWIHGGGFALGAPEQDFSFIEAFVKASGCVVVAPDYLNSPDAPFPAAFDDCYSALLWLKENGKDYGMRDDQIFVGGNSAGGGLCAAVTLKARDTGDVNIAFQMPLYPMLDDRMITESSQNNDAPIWNTKSNLLAWQLYLGELFGTDDVPKYAAPAREEDYAGLPPTLTYIGTIEPFWDETNIYVENLKAAGVEVMFKTFEGCFHGFDLFSFTTPAKQARQFLIDGFMYAVDNYTAAN
ncbi:MAG: alpha/beta hydrolase [Clostridia bacterium]|nr:alpha/beta hydrolase [Clostridia bacterium]